MEADLVGPADVDVLDAVEEIGARTLEVDLAPQTEHMLRLLESGRGWVKLCAYRSDLSGAPFVRAGPFVQALETAAPERLVWGTDWPHPNLPERAPGLPIPMPDDGDLVDALGFWFEDRAALERILVANPARLYGFGERS